jgi:hypothetical protein
MTVGPACCGAFARPGRDRRHSWHRHRCRGLSPPFPPAVPALWVLHPKVRVPWPGARKHPGGGQKKTSRGGAGEVCCVAADRFVRRKHPLSPHGRRCDRIQRMPDAGRPSIALRLSGDCPVQSTCVTRVVLRKRPGRQGAAGERDGLIRPSCGK